MMDPRKEAALAEALRRRKSPQAFPGASGEIVSDRDILSTGPLEGPAFPESPPVVARPGSVPAQVAQSVVAAQPRPPAPVPQFAPPEDDSELDAAREADRQSRLAAGMELAGRQLVAGITRTPVPQGLGVNPSEVPIAMARAKSKREQAAEALMRQRQATMDASTLDLQKSMTEKNRREPGPRGGVDYTESRAAQQALDAAKLEETIRHNKANEAKPRGGPKAPPKDKTLPVSTLTELADFDSAAKELDRLAGRFVELDQGGYWAKLKAKGSDMLGMQGSDAAIYASEAKRAMQGVGKILEGGKLAAGDEDKYRRLMPEAGDSPERLHSKVQGLKTMLADLKAGRIGAYRAAGYQTGNMGEETKTVGGKTYRKVPGGWDPVN